jgi:SAM-dependent methyltransferase
VVATDLDPRFLADEAIANLEVRQHDIVSDPLEEGTFDLVHARAVLEHIPARTQALARMVQATRPGGWVVVEDIHLGGPMIPVTLRYVMPPEHVSLCERVIRAFEALFTTAGVDVELGAHLPGLLHAAGLTQVGAELHGRFVWGGSGRDFGRLSLEHLQGRMIGAGLLTEEEIAHFLALTRQPNFGYLPLPMVTAWGQRPVR